MCGIAGLIGTANEVERTGAVRKMTDSIARRGPDGEGITVWGEAVLGHRRLSIIDLSDAGRQPMLSADGAIGVVFNGEIYNFIDLRNELKGRGYTFTSDTDTEVLIHGYESWGLDELVSRLRGMFAFALWDDRKRKCFLVRDRLGVKPLLYSMRDGCLAFASTARALKSGGFAGEIDEQAIAEYLEFGFITDKRSIYKNVSKVAAASIVEWSEGKLRARHYWSPPEVDESCKLSFNEAVEETERIFLEAVKLRLHADVPVGALLSGGVDSSLVCWAVAQLGGDVTAYTVGTPGDPWDETSDATATARALGMPHRVLGLSPTDAPDVQELVSAFGEPFACASALGMLSVSQAVAGSAKVLLTGDGGDDVFLGYPEHRHFWFAEKLARALPRASGKLWLRARASFPARGHLRRIRSFIDYTTGGLGAVTNARDGLPMYRSNRLLGERLIDATIDQRAIPWSPDSARELLTEFLIHDRRTRFTGEYLPKVDGATMHHSIEARSPFLDQKLWEFASALPFSLRLKGGNLKAILRELARRKIGERVASGRKRGFGIPVQRWLAGRWRSAVEDSFRDSLLEREGWLRSDAILVQLEKAAQQGWASNQLWYSFVLETWLRREREQSSNLNSAGAEKISAVASFR
ncbi:MAG TPA: asparagine synthase (glutamine-hydrolyzing) [Blastocatellia bacterium]|nr:asparagine synthase (glutamine-hydrolyzing) [Blastocatellia bacterium]